MQTITKKLRLLGACAFAAAGLLSSSYAQIQVAGNLQVDLDARTQPLGALTSLPNSGVAGGGFDAIINAGVGPQVIALGGDGTHGILFDGNCMLAHRDGTGNPLLAPANMVSTNPVCSVEAWVFAPMLIDDSPVVSWGTRGSCGGQASCAYGANGTWGGFAMWCNDKPWPGGTPPAGAWHHLAWTLTNNPAVVGNTIVTLYADGVLRGAYTNVAANIDANNNILIAASHNSTGGTTDGVTGGVIVGRVRVHDGVLSDAQVLNNYAYEVGSFTNGTPAFLAAKPTHRWSFTAAATNDAVGLTISDTGTIGGSTNAAVVKGTYGSGAAQFTGTQLYLAGGSSLTQPYVDLPNGLISSLSASKGGSGQFTIEGWVNMQGAQQWARIFDFGSNTVGEVTGPGPALGFSGDSYFTMAGTPGNPADLNNSSVGFLDVNSWFKSHLSGALNHFAVAWDEAAGVISVYENGILIKTITTTHTFADINDVNDWLGRSNWSGDNNMQGYFSEFRIYNRLLSPNELLNNYQVGPTVVDKVLKWNGNLSGNWDVNTTANWLSGTAPVKYNDNGTIQFDDTLTGTPNVNLTTTVRPAVLTVNNSLSNYTFSGTGKISGTNGLTKSGTASLTIGGPGLNDFTGATVLMNGTLAVSNLANGGLPSSIGASPAAPNSLTLSGGTLSYRGPAASINRGYTLAASTTLDIQNDLALGGTIVSTAGTLTKTGPATLTYNGTGLNKIGGGSFYVGSGTVVVDGSAGQTNTVGSETWVGFNQASSAALILTNALYTNSSWFAIGRGNGSGGYASSVSLFNSTLSCGAMSLGYANGVAGNKQTVSLTLNGNSRIWENGDFNLSESSGSTSTININDNSFIRTPNRLLMGQGATALGILNISGHGALTNGGWTSLGAPGSAVATLKDNAIWEALVDFNVTDTAGSAATPSVGTLNIQDNALLRINTLYVGKSAYCTGTINQNGGTVFRNGGGDWRLGGNVSNGANQLGIWNLTNGIINAGGANFQIGAYGTGYLNQYGGTVYSSGGYPDVGRFAGGVGYVNISGGTFYQSGTGNRFIVGEAGTGTINVSGTGAIYAYQMGLGWTATGIGTLNLTNGAVYATNNFIVGNNATGVGTVNLYGGTLATRRLYGNGGTDTFNFNGGTLLAMPGASASFISGLTTLSIGANPVTIDSDTNNITIAQNLVGAGAGSLTKLGSGTLTFSGTSGYAGQTLVNAGKLARAFPSSTTDASAAYVFADGTGLAVQPGAAYQQLTVSALTLASSTAATLDFALGTLPAGNPTAAPLAVSGALTANGTVTVNLSASGLQVGSFPLIKYGSLAGTGSYVLGTLPAGVVATLQTNAVNQSLDLNITAVHILLWTGLVPGGAWDIALSANWTNLLTGNASTYLQGGAVIFDDSAPGTNVIALDTNVAPSSLAFSNNVLAYTIQGSGTISGKAGLNLYGTNSVVTLATTGNTYTGPSTANGGSLTVTVPGALSPNSSLSLTNTALNLGANSQTVGAFSFANGTVSASGSTLTAPSFALQNAAVNARLAGSGPLLTVGTNSVLVADGNTYAGSTTLGGGTLYATNLANGGLPSSIGASSASPTNLVFAGGALNYQGPSVAIDRGYTVAGGGTLTHNADLALGGPVTASSGGFTKNGSGKLTYLSSGTNSLSTGTYVVDNGALVLDGSAGAQVNSIGNEFWVGSTPNSPASVLLTNTTLNIGSWMAIGRGNGASNFFSSVTLNNSVVTANYASMGYDAGRTNLSSQALVLNGNSAMTLRGTDNGYGLFVGESSGGSGALYLNDTARLNSLRLMHVGRGPGAAGSVAVAQAATLAISNNASVGYQGSGSLLLKDNAAYINTGDLNVADLANSQGTLNLQDNAQLGIGGALYVGKSLPSTGVVNQVSGTVTRLSGGADWRIAGSTNGDAATLGTYNLYSGVLNAGPGNFQIGAYGVGAFNQSGGSVTIGGYPSVGRYLGGVGTLDVAGGSFNQTNALATLLVGEAGTGTLTVTNTGVVNAQNLGVGWVNAATTHGFVNINGGAVNVAGLLTVGNGAAEAAVNLNGGSLTVGRILSVGAAGSAFNFNGGVLHAGPGASPTFMGGLGVAYIYAGGAFIDSGANTIDIAQPLYDGGGNGGLTKLGAGVLSLSGLNYYSGLTTVSNGTLLVNGSINGPTEVFGGALGGSGSCSGAVTVEPGATLAPGAGGVGTLTCGSLTLKGNLAFEVNKSLANPSDYVNVFGTLDHTGPGTLTVANLGPALVPGDSFVLFSQPVPAGDTYTIVSPGVTWTNRLAVDGSIAVLAVAPPIPTTPTNVTYTVSSSGLTLSWPTNYLGWSLETQTNALVKGLSTNWVIVPGSSNVTSLTLPVDHSNPTVFYRLVYPQP